MIIYLYGPDSYRRHKKLKGIVVKYKEKHAAVTVERFFLESESDFERLRDFVKYQSLFDDFQLAIIHTADISLKKEFAELLQSHMDTKSTILLISAEKKLPKEFPN